MKECYFATLLKVTLLQKCFSRFLNCTNGTKSRNASIFRKFSWALSEHLVIKTISFLTIKLNKFLFSHTIKIISIIFHYNKQPEKSLDEWITDG